MTILASNSNDHLQDPLIVAHRGASGLYPELTFQAFNEALKMPIHGIECDVRLTRDGELIVFHDPILSRTTNGRGRVSATDYADLRTLNAGTKDNPQRIMRLAELLELMQDYPDKHIYIETKHPTRYGPEVDEQTLRVLHYAGLRESERVHLISFSHRAMRYFTEFAPELETFYLFRLREKKWNRGNHMLSRPYGVGPALSHLQAKRELLGFRGLRTYTWTVNLPKQMLWCRDNGVDVFATDLPQLAMETFAKHPVATTMVG
ncbi:glycerophosphodiester phosphodiesterase family protein [Corynebacterium liangguodongii]|uniref:Glycerophosphodiester phosphodiesterase n=1 Tax=Corynebacterium liangguodongii TaxID=2079535 RepID=A0A2S0WGG6_9CORY|nr:glycerophosphodiester phosphodiesterase family protein [Corynebacterium liangguodongii]AWB84871.1 glycerophosphodiester phosphodiesterase [Corynebacterium liangguodongii]PWB99228.1 glycerophosphodiester phosphodiesterase [Corynebacterium liangguodongii]